MARRVSTPTLPFLWARLLHALVIERVEKPEPGRNRVGLGILPRGIQLVCDNRAGQDVARRRTDMLSAPAPYPTVSTEIRRQMTRRLRVLPLRSVWTI